MIETNNIPQHIAIIMDGNGRWATERGQDRSFGHKAGVDAVRTITSECTRLGVKFLTLYTFSTENWSRPSLEDEIFMKNNVRFRVIGDLSRIPDNVRRKLHETEEHTAKNEKMTMVVALSYSSKLEMVNAIRNIAQEVKDGKMNVEDIDEKAVDERLWTNFMPDPELLIRTGGELRISNYLLWQIAYSELYFCDTYWPDFDEACLHKAIESYQSRQRRFGKTEAQVENEQ